jgi:hypothetical protein
MENTVINSPHGNAKDKRDVHTVRRCFPCFTTVVAVVTAAAAAAAAAVVVVGVAPTKTNIVAVTKDRTHIFLAFFVGTDPTSTIST